MVDHKYFDMLIFVSLIANSIVLCFKWYDMDPGLEKRLENANTAFMILYLFEFSLKFYAYRKIYFKNNWNRLDFFAILISLLAFLLGTFLD